MSSQKLKSSLLDSVLASDTTEINTIVGSLDKEDSAAVADVLDVMVSVIKEFVLSAASLQSRKEDGWAFWDLDGLAGYEYPGLISGILKEKFPTLAPAPPADELEQALDSAGFTISSATRRLAFFKGWMASRATTSLENIAHYLSEMNIIYDSMQLSRIEWMICADVSGSIRYVLAKCLKKISPARSQAIRKVVEETYLKEIL